MQPETLNCPNCGAASSSDEPRCQFCGSRLATVACPSCFAMMFVGSKHCQRCGAAAVIPEATDSKPRKCPRCSSLMVAAVIGKTKVSECEKCFGLWLDVPSFEKICADREQQSAVLGMATHAPTSGPFESRVHYVRCPECSQLMNRMNFARCSGIIVDICRQHGTWFDRDELSRIIEFISGGGLEVSRQRDKEEIKAERRRLAEQQAAVESRVSAHFRRSRNHEQWLSGIASARGLLKFLLDKN